MARPKKGDGNLRTDKIEVRTTPDEKLAIKKNAKNAGFETSEYLRSLGLQTNIRLDNGVAKKARRVATDDQEVLIRLKGEIGKLGSNVNQIARALNLRQQTGEKINVPDEVIINAMKSIDTLTQHLLELLGW